MTESTEGIKLLSLYTGLVVDVRGIMYHICLDDSGYIVTRETTDRDEAEVIGRYTNPFGWEQFYKDNPVLANLVKDAILERMRNTIDLINTDQWGIQEIPFSAAGSTEPDIMFGGMYQ